MEKRAMTFLIIEDDLDVCVEYKQCFLHRDDIKLVGMTNSVEEGFQLIKECMPEAVILDIELHEGKGFGLDLFEMLEEIDLNIRPLIAVSTKVMNEAIHDYAHKQKAVIFSKSQEGYSAERVLNSVIRLRPSVYRISKVNQMDCETREKYQADRQKAYLSRIHHELELIGVPKHLTGHRYIVTGLMYLLTSNPKDTDDTVFNYISKEYSRGTSAVVKAIATAIRYAWNRTPIDELTVHYTERVDYNTGEPRPIQFMCYYSDKIKKACAT